MKIIFVALGSYGDLIPMLNAAAFAAEHGFHVEIIGYSFFRDFVRTRLRDVEFFGVCTIEMYKEMARCDQQLGEHHIAAHHFNCCIRYSIEPVFNHIEAAAKADDCIIVGYTFSPGAAWAARKFNIPFIRMALSSADLEFSLTLNEDIEQQRRHLFAEATEFGTALYEKLAIPGQFNWLVPFELSLCFFPEAFVSNAKADHSFDIRKCHFLGFAPNSTSNTVDTSMDRERFCNGQDYFLYTSGTPFTSSLNDYLEFGELCTSFNVNGLFVSQNRDFDVSRHFSKHIQVVDFCDLPEAIRGSKLVISHGGIGTVADAMLAAVPQLVVPKAFDQFHNAGIVNRLGFGLTIEPGNFSCNTGLAHKAAEAIKLTEGLGDLISKYKLDQFHGDDFLSTLTSLSAGR